MITSWIDKNIFCNIVHENQINKKEKLNSYMYMSFSLNYFKKQIPHIYKQCLTMIMFQTSENYMSIRVT